MRYLDALKHWSEENGKSILVLDAWGMQLQWPVPENGAGSVSRFMWQLVAWFAEEEWLSIAEKQAAARLTVSENRGFIGKPAFGFEVIGEKYNRSFRPVPELAPILREMVRRGTRGDTLRSIGQWLDTVAPCRQLGDTIKGKTILGWSDNSVKSLLKNRSLIGEQWRTVNGRWMCMHRSQHPLITVEAFNELQKRFTNGREDVARNRGDDAALLTGLIFCDVCGSGCTGMRRVGSARTVRRTRCFTTGAAGRTLVTSRSTATWSA